MDQQDVVPAAESHDPGIQFRRAHAAYGVGGQADQHQLGGAGHFLGNGGNVRQKMVLFGQAVVPGFGAAQQAAGHKDGVAGVGQQRHVAVVAQRQAQVPDAVLAAGKAHDPVRRDPLHAEAAFVIGADGLQQFRQVPQAVFPVFILLRSFHKSLLDVGGGRKIRRAHAQIIQMAALRLQSDLFIVQGGEDLGPEQLQPMGKFHAKNLVSKVRIQFIIPPLPPPCKSCRIMV